MTETVPAITATGRRKNAIARITMVSGSGKITFNDKSLDEFFGGNERQKKQVTKPIDVYAAAKGYDIDINATGGGVTGQAEAARHGIARAIIALDPTARLALKKEGFLTRDSRMVERKKPGRPKARKRFQFSKR